MPELPEVETIKEGLAKRIVGVTINDVKVLNPKSFIGNHQEIIGGKVAAIDRRAKILIIKTISNPSPPVGGSLRTSQQSAINYLLIHLKMTGQLIYRLKIDDLRFKNENTQRYDVEKLPNKYTRAIISFTNGAKLYFNDLRKFGWMKLVKVKSQMSNVKTKINEVIGANLGPEPFSDEFSPEYLKKIFSKTVRAIKLVLMDQEKIAGVGNIYASEALFEARILPTKPAKKLGNSEIQKLREAIVKVLEKGIKYGGSTSADEAYRNITGEKGKMQEHFAVYEREGGKCPRCGGMIKKIRLGGRGTYYCPKCQK